MERKTILILAKTYPTPSKASVETSCIAGIDDKGEMIRLFPVPFRLMEGNQRFKKWQWIEVLTSKASDKRTESYKVHIDENSPKLLQVIDSKNWPKRVEAISKAPTFTSFEEMEEARTRDKISLAFFKPHKINKLDIVAEKSPEWSEEDVSKLRQALNQPDLFSPQNPKEINELRKMPYHFYYEYTYFHKGKAQNGRSKITDWEAGALYWNCSKEQDWEAKVRDKLEFEMIQKDAYFLMGTMHRFPDQWLIISIIYPPKSKQNEVSDSQGCLF